MVVIDSDVFLIDCRYQRDEKYEINKRFLTQAQMLLESPSTTIFNVLEVCGVLSFNLNERQLQAFYSNFSRQYHLTILAPQLPDDTRQLYLERFYGRILGVISLRVAFADALVILTAESYLEATDLVTWNASHFTGKTRLHVRTPENWLQEAGI